MKPNFSPETISTVWLEWFGICCNCHKNYIVDYHHIVSNSVMYRNKFGDKIQSIENCAPVCRKCHENTSWAKELKHKLIKKWSRK